jgi:hypothetical protein
MNKEYQKLVNEFGEDKARMILLYGSKQKGKKDEIKRAKILGTLRTGQNTGRSDGNRGKTV